MIRLVDLFSAIQRHQIKADLSLIRRAYAYCSGILLPQRKGAQRLQHHLQVAAILTRLKLDGASIVAGMIHEVVIEDPERIEEVRGYFGEEVASLVDGVSRLEKIIFRPGEERQSESFRKMLFSLARDVRIILIKLAERTHQMRVAHPGRPETIALATEVRAVYAPLANRMGISWLKSELEDLAFQHLEPEAFRELSSIVARKRSEREAYVEQMKREVLKILGKMKVKAEVSGRFKHLSSLYAKMQRQKVGFDQIYDLIAFRVIVDSVRDCYAVLGGVHANWKPIPGRFKDYIAMPKVNGYQSLHTTVVGPNQERVEIQIRTDDMHSIAEDGIAAHWRYKEGKHTPEISAEEKKFSWLRQLMEWQRDLHDEDDGADAVRVELFPEEVYVFTPDGAVRELPRGSCTIDFAYAIHSEVGDHCTGAKVNGRLVPLKTELVNGDVVEIITSPNQHPNKDWLKFVKTARARTKVRHWVKQEQFEKSIELGREMLEKELRKYGRSLNKLIDSPEIMKAVEDAGLKGVDDLLASIGYGKVSNKMVISHLVSREEIDRKPRTNPLAKVISKIRKKSSSGITIHGLDDIMVRFANCCRPLPGDPVRGFVSRGRGITVHAENCRFFEDADEERIIDVEWDLAKKITRPAKLLVLCVDKKGILMEMTGVISNCEANIISANVKSKPGQMGENLFEVEVNDNDHLTQVINALRQVRGVFRVERL